MTMAVTFAFGWFLMGKLDCFFESNRHMQELLLSSGENTLRLGFCNPTVADSITNVLEQYSKLYPDISVHIFCGSEEELLKGLSAGKFNVIFLSENAEIPAHMHYNSKMVSLNYTPVVMKYGGLPIEPIANGHITQKVLWIGEIASTFAICFIKCLEDHFAVPTLGK
ncbi:MAG: hypothetical protein Q4C59_14710 [Lachnospiraceae bacterium]|nr:hypothetical protein [Lachnospiraceae bacterium]